MIDRVNIKSIPRETSRFARMTRTVWLIYREALRQEADVYHFHDPELIPAGLLLRLAGKNVIYDLHEDYPKDILAKGYLPRWSRGTVAWLMEQLEKATCRHFSAIVAVTPAIAERLRMINRRTVVVYNYPRQEEVVLRDFFVPWSARQQTIAYIGGITRQRGIREMVAAMNIVLPSLGATLELLGPTVSGDIQLEEFQKHPGWARVRYRGVLDSESTFRTLHTVKAGLVPFHPIPNALESLPQKLFEYMGAGIPVIASNFPLWRRIVEDSGCGIVVDPLDPVSIAQAIEYVLTHPHEAEEMGRRGQAAVLERYNWSKEAEKLVALYSGLVKPCAA